MQNPFQTLGALSVHVQGAIDLIREIPNKEFEQAAEALRVCFVAHAGAMNRMQGPIAHQLETEAIEERHTNLFDRRNVEAVIDARNFQAQTPHKFVGNTSWDLHSKCDACGLGEDAVVHGGKADQ